MALDLLRHLEGEVGAAVVHGQQQPLQVNPGVQPPLDNADGGQKIAQPLQGVVLTLHRYQHGIRCAQGVQGQQFQRGGTVNEDVVIVFRHLLQGVFQSVLPLLQGDYLNGGPRQRLVGGEHIAVGGGGDGLSGLRPVEKHVIDVGRGGLVYAEAGSGVGLGVKIAHQHPAALVFQSRRQVDTGGSLSHAALLIHNRNGLCHSTPAFLGRCKGSGSII